MPENNTENQETEAQEAAGAPETDETPTAGETHTDSVETPEDDAQGVSGDAEDDDEPTALKKARKEAAERRVAAREATERADTLQAERDELVTQLEAFKNGMLAQLLDQHTKVSLDAFTAAGHTLDDVTDDGVVDFHALKETSEDTEKRFGTVRSYRNSTAPGEAAQNALDMLGPDWKNSGRKGGTQWGQVLNRKK